jgi:hypothetical protein
MYGNKTAIHSSINLAFELMALYRDHQLHDREPDAPIDRWTKFSRARCRDNFDRRNNAFRYCFGRTRRDYSPRRDGADFRETFIDFRGTIVRPAQTPWKIGIGSVGACHVSRLGSGGHRSAVVPLARGLRQVRQTREQDRRAAQLERAANRA